MKKFDLLGAIVNTVLSVCMGMAVVGCMTTAFHLESYSFEALFACFFWAVISCVVLQLPRGWIAIPVCLALWWLLLWKADTDYQFGMLLRTLFTVYSKAYGIQVPHGLLSYTEPNVTQAMTVIGCIVTIIAGTSLTWLRSGTLAVMTTGFAVIPCFLVIDTVPHAFFLFLLLSCCALAILTQNLRWREPRQANRLTAMLLVPVLLANLLLFHANPQEEFDKRPPDSFEELLAEMFQPLITPIKPTLPSVPSLPSLPSLPDLSGLTTGHVNLQYVGPNKNNNDLVMQVQTDLRGTLYLRGKSYSDYNGLSWSTSPIPDDSMEIERTYLRSYLNNTKYSTVSIRTVSANSIYYTAYYAPTNANLEEGAYKNHNKQSDYTIPVDPLRDDWKTVYLRYFSDETLQDITQIDHPPGDFTSLPEETRTQAKQYLEENHISSGTPILSAAEAIASLVRNSARYDLNTPRMPSDAPDFALWFLKNSDTGYCIHFASAAVVLLRAAGIPARYVVGYVTSVNSDGIANVTESEAHAWAEYYLPKVGWVMLEATPSEGWEPPVETTNPTDPSTKPTEPTTEPTLPSTIPTVPTTEPTLPTTIPTEPTTEPTQPPTIPTVPTEPTTGPTQLPTEPTEPTEPTAPTTQPSTSTTVPVTNPTRPSSSVPATTTPGIDPPVEPKADLTWLWATLQLLLLLILAATALIGQWRLRLWMRKKWISGGTTNTQALRRWRYVKRLAKLRRQDAPAALKELALKARFSQHTISSEELAAFDGYFDRSVTHLKSRNLFLRLVYRLILAAY